MDIFKASERIMAMDDETWARHASPWSVYTRFTCLPLLVLAVWSRVWLGWWALVPIALALAWTWWNPRAFRPRADPDSWAAKGTYGERVFLARKDSPVPAHHLAWALGLTRVSAAGAAVLIWGLVELDPWATVFGMVLTIGGKLWFCDRMVWLYEDARRAGHPGFGA